MLLSPILIEISLKIEKTHFKPKTFHTHCTHAANDSDVCGRFRGKYLLSPPFHLRITVLQHLQ